MKQHSSFYSKWCVTIDEHRVRTGYVILGLLLKNPTLPLRLILTLPSKILGDPVSWFWPDKGRRPLSGDWGTRWLSGQLRGEVQALWAVIACLFFWVLSLTVYITGCKMGGLMELLRACFTVLRFVQCFSRRVQPSIHAPSAPTLYDGEVYGDCIPV